MENYMAERAMSELVGEMDRNWERAEIPLRADLRVIGRDI